eukprot:SAG22_NODE_1425_length_4459_cov_5.864220_4_plen_274_part_00
MQFCNSPNSAMRTAARTQCPVTCHQYCASDPTYGPCGCTSAANLNCSDISIVTTACPSSDFGRMVPHNCDHACANIFMAWYGRCVAKLDATPALAPFMKLVSDQLAEFNASCAAESNVALNKPATLKGGPDSQQMLAKYCVDGLTDESTVPSDPGYRCASKQTTNIGTEPFGWLIIDLEQPYTIDTVEIWNRIGSMYDDRINGGMVRLCGKDPKLPPFCTDDTQLAGFPITTTEPLYILDNLPKTGLPGVRWVQVEAAPHQMLNLRQVKVWGK